MANSSPRQPDKVSADCPHCGFSQLELAYAKSTFCRKCGQHFNIDKLLSKEADSIKGPSLFDKFSKLISGEKVRTAQCFSCAHKQEVSSAAQSSLCPSCGSYIDLRDIKIAGPFGRAVQTQGEVHITSKGDVSSTKLACGSALVEGKMRGTLFCTGIARVKMQGKLLGTLEVHELVIDKKSNVEFVRPVKVDHMEVNGHVSAARVMSEHGVTVRKGGHLEGTVYAKSIDIEKGGFFNGELFIGQKPAEQTELIAPPVEEEVQPEPQPGEMFRPRRTRVSRG